MRKALTVGELLVAMTIIGVIAMLVLPSFLKDYHKKLYTTRIKKVYEMVSEAVERACVDSNVSYFQQTIYSQSNKDAQQAFLNKYFKRASSSTAFPFASQYGSIKETKTEAPDVKANTANAKLAGGEALAIACEHDKAQCTVYVDINSLEGPNIGGRDFFQFKINSNNNTIISKPTNNTPCISDTSGEACLDLLIKNNWIMEYE